MLSKAAHIQLETLPKNKLFHHRCFAILLSGTLFSSSFRTNQSNQPSAIMQPLKLLKLVSLALPFWLPHFFFGNWKLDVRWNGCKSRVTLLLESLGIITKVIQVWSKAWWLVCSLLERIWRSPSLSFRNVVSLIFSLKKITYFPAHSAHAENCLMYQTS